ncbi:MAG: 2-C-methyl-D-erythritol 4-phosphate cytidylyltransferase, partial [Marinilabiliales bacterium]
MNRFVIIVAGGSGQRMGSTIPKQFLNIHKEVILMKSISAFHLFDPEIQIVLALPEHQISYWNELCSKNNFKIEHFVVQGGITRYQSVKNALETINTDGMVAIHDGVRPLVSRETIKQVFDVATRNGNAVPYIDLVDSIRYIHNGINE